MNEPADANFSAYLAEGRFMLQRSRSTGAFVFPPRVMLPGDGRNDLEWIEASGSATVHSFTIVPQRAPEQDYNVCLVDLAEGPRMMSSVVEVSNEEIAIGLAVEARIVENEGGRHIVFGPAKG